MLTPCQAGTAHQAKLAHPNRALPWARHLRAPHTSVVISMGHFGNLSQRHYVTRKWQGLERGRHFLKVTQQERGNLRTQTRGCDTTGLCLLS